MNNSAESNATHAADAVNFLVFKDHFAARSFQVPARWFRATGYLLLLLTIVTILAVFSAIRYYRAVRRIDPARTHELEEELAELQSAYQILESKTTGTQQTTPAPKSTDAAQVPPDAQASAARPQIPVSAASFAVIPVSAGLPPNPNSLSIRVNSPTASWSARSLKVHFDIQYVQTDGGNQQGHIVMMARGPKTVLGYPEQVFNAPGKGSLVEPSRGEYFSVSRFREVKAEFGPLASHDALKSVDVLIFDTDGKLIYFETVAATEQPRPQSPAAEPKTPPAAEKPRIPPPAAAQPRTPPAALTQPRSGSANH